MKRQREGKMVRRIHLARATSLPTSVSSAAGTLTLWTDDRMVHAAHDVVASSRKLILVIDDSATVRMLIETCLRREGFEVKGFPDGIEALRWLTDPSARVPDLVLLDIGLPRLDGYEVAQRLKAMPQLSKTVIVMLSRRDGMLDRLKGRLAGATDYLTKPWTSQELIAVVQSHLVTRSTGRHAQTEREVMQ